MHISTLLIAAASFAHIFVAAQQHHNEGFQPDPACLLDLRNSIDCLDDVAVQASRLGNTVPDSCSGQLKELLIGHIYGFGSCVCEAMNLSGPNAVLPNSCKGCFPNGVPTSIEEC